MRHYQPFEHTSAKLRTQMGLVEVLDPQDRVYFTVFLVDMPESGKQILVRYVNEKESTWVDAARILRSRRVVQTLRVLTLVLHS